MRSPGTLRKQVKVNNLDSGWHGVLLKVVLLYQIVWDNEIGNRAYGTGWAISLPR